MLSGDGGTGKSLLALQLAVAITAETTWLGIGVTFGPVLFVSAEEDQTEIHNRLYEIARAQGIDLSDVANHEIVYLAGKTQRWPMEGGVAGFRRRCF